MSTSFRAFAEKTADAAGRPSAFIVSGLVVVVWGTTGYFFHYSDTWQLVINTGTTIVTFLMVFLIQNTQNRDAKAIHLKLNELLRAVSEARNRLVDLEDLSEEELNNLQDEFKKLRQNASDLACAAERERDDAESPVFGQCQLPTNRASCRDCRHCRRRVPPRESGG